MLELHRIPLYVSIKEKYYHYIGASDMVASVANQERDAMEAEVAAGSATERRRLVSLERREADRPIRLNRPGIPDARSAAPRRGLQAPRLSIFGLVSRVVPLAELIEGATCTAAKIVSFPCPVVMEAKGCVDQSYQAPLAAGLLFERRMLRATSALTDRKQGTAPFSGKRAGVQESMIPGRVE